MGLFAPTNEETVTCWRKNSEVHDSCDSDDAIESTSERFERKDELYGKLNTANSCRRPTAHQVSSSDGNSNMPTGLRLWTGLEEVGGRHRDDGSNVDEMPSDEGRPSENCYLLQRHDSGFVARRQCTPRGDLPFHDRFEIIGDAEPEMPQSCFAVDKQTNKKVLLRHYHRDSRQYRQNVEMHQSLYTNEYICQMILSDDSEGSEHAWLALETGEYSLAELLSRGPLTSVQTTAIICQIAEALQSIHAQEIVHGNLCPSQITWCSADHCWKFTSLESALYLDDRVHVNESDISKYTAPEISQAVQQGKKHISRTPAADIWSLGAIASEIFEHSKVYEYMTNGRQLASRQSSLRQQMDDSPIAFYLTKQGDRVQHQGEQHTSRFIQDLLQEDPTRRPTATQILESNVLRCSGDINAADERQRCASELEETAQKASIASNLRLSVTPQRSARKTTLSRLGRGWKKANTFRDEYLPMEQSVQLLRIGEDYRLRICITTKNNFRALFKGVVSIDVVTPEQKKLSLPFTLCHPGKSIETFATLPLSEFDSYSLNRVSPQYGSPDEKYVKLDVVVRFRMGASPFEIELGEELYCQMVHPRKHLALHEAWAKFKCTWRRFPQSARTSIRGFFKIIERLVGFV